jgi:hypothetical protein
MSSSRLEAPFVLEKRVTFRAWGARSNLVVAADRRGLYFCEKPLDIGEDGGDERLIVSPSGKYLVTGVSYGCHTGDRDCFADDLAVISLATGLQEYRYQVPVTKSKSVEQLSGDGPPVELMRSTPSRVDVAWADDDTLILSPDSDGGPSKRTLLRRRKNGEWKRLGTRRGRRTDVEGRCENEVTTELNPPHPFAALK